MFAVTSASPGNKVLIYEPFNYNLVYTYTPVSPKVVQTARFSKDLNYMGVGFNDGSVELLSKQTFSSFVSFTPEATKTVADIAFNYANNKLLVCYTNSPTFYIINNYAGTATTASKTLTLTTGIKGCKLSRNDDVVIIDVTSRVYVFPVTLGTVTTNSSSAGGPYADVDVKNSATTPIKIILGGKTDNLGYTLLNGATRVNLFFAFTQTGPITAVCYSPDNLNFAMGNSANNYMWVFD